MAQVAVVQIKAACDALTSAGHSSAGFYEEQLHLECHFEGGLLF